MNETRLASLLESDPPVRLDPELLERYAADELSEEERLQLLTAVARSPEAREQWRLADAIRSGSEGIRDRREGGAKVLPFRRRLAGVLPIAATLILATFLGYRVFSPTETLEPVSPHGPTVDRLTIELHEVRSDDQPPPVVVIDPGSFGGTVPLSISLPVSPEAVSWDVALFGADGPAIWSDRNRAVNRSDDGGGRIELELPREHLAPGNRFHLMLVERPGDQVFQVDLEIVPSS